MPADGNLSPALSAVLVQASKRQTASVRTIFTTEHPHDAELAGFDFATPAGTDGGFSVTYDGRHSIPSVILNGSDGEIEVTGWQAIEQLATALMEAGAMARRQQGVV